MVIQGGSFKGKGGDLKPKEVVSLLLDDEELEKRYREQQQQIQARKNVSICLNGRISFVNTFWCCLNFTGH
jgi:hypothetical protein